MIFFGTSSFSLHVLDRLLELGIKPSHIVTVPDQPKGRKLIMTAPPAKVWAERHGVPYFQFQKLDTEAVETLKMLDPEIFLVASYGKIIPHSVLDIPKKGSLNIHPSLLPKYRGATPLQSTILADDKDTGVTLMLMDDKMDHGPILATKRPMFEPWPPTMNEYEYTLARAGADLAQEYISNPEKFPPQIQDETKATFTKKIEKEDGLISLEELTGDKGRETYLKYIAFDGWPGTYFFAEKTHANDTKKIRVNIKEATWNESERKLEIKRVIPEGKKEMGWKEFQNYLHI
jgi:methionyl-tRNA formyltransferase